MRQNNFFLAFSLFLISGCSNFNGHEKANIIYLVILLGVFLISALSMHNQYKTMFKYLTLWLAIFVVIFLAYSYRDNIVNSQAFSELFPKKAIKTAENTYVLSKAINGHFMIDLDISGQKIEFLIDTGASDISLDPNDAKKLGFDLEKLDYIRIYQTANGQIKAAPVRLNYIYLGNLRFNKIAAVVTENPSGGSLLGMSFLKLFSSFEIKGDKLYLKY